MRCRALRPQGGARATGSTPSQLAQLFGHGDMGELLVVQRGEELDAPAQHTRRLAESRTLVLIGALHRGRIGYAPVCCHRLARPDRPDLTGCVVAYGEDEIHPGRPGL